MYKQEIINAIDKKMILEIVFNKESDGSISVKNVAPYDIFPNEDKNGITRDVLLGYAEANIDNTAHVIKIYLDNITRITNLNRLFDGDRIRNLIRPKNPPHIPRNW